MANINVKNGKWLLIEAFAIFNFAFLGLDIYIAHYINRFSLWQEWIPFAFSLGSASILALLLYFAYKAEDVSWYRLIGYIIAGSSIIVGLLGFYYHLESGFFHHISIKNLVYTAPFVAPLAFAGLGCLMILSRIEDVLNEEWGLWVTFLAMGGFVGNFILSLADHAQNGFFNSNEWIGVVASAIVIGFLLAAVSFREDVLVLNWAIGLSYVQIAIGLLGFYFHFSANYAGGSTFVDNFLYGAPIFAPMLFSNLGILALIGLYDIRSKQ
jgi:hypothetical protein